MPRNHALGVLLACFAFPQASLAFSDVDSIDVNEDGTANISTIYYDGGVKSYTRTVEKQPSHGQMSPFDGTWIKYTPNPNYYGRDDVVLKVHTEFDDGKTDDWTLAVYLNVVSVNDYPVAHAATVHVAKDTKTKIVLLGEDPVENSPIKFGVSAPYHGTITDSLGAEPGVLVPWNGPFYYTPDAGFTGVDSFLFFAHDGTDQSDEVIESIVVDGFTGISRTAVPQDAFATTTATDLLGRTRTVTLHRSGSTYTGDFSRFAPGTWIFRVPATPSEIRRIVVP